MFVLCLWHFSFLFWTPSNNLPLRPAESDQCSSKDLILTSHANRPLSLVPKNVPIYHSTLTSIYEWKSSISNSQILKPPQNFLRSDLQPIERRWWVLMRSEGRRGRRVRRASWPSGQRTLQMPSSSAITPTTTFALPVVSTRLSSRRSSSGCVRFRSRYFVFVCKKLYFNVTLINNLHVLKDLLEKKISYALKTNSKCIKRL